MEARKLTLKLYLNNTNTTSRTPLPPQPFSFYAAVIIMVFTPPSWVPQLPMDPPDSIPISEFMLSDKYGRHPLQHSRPPFTCGLTGAEYSALEVRERVNALARGLSKELGWLPNKGTEWDKVIGVFSVNTVRLSSRNTRA